MFTQDSYPHPGVEFPVPRLVLCFGEAFTKVGLAGDTWCQLLWKATDSRDSTLLVGWLQIFSIHLHGILWMLVTMTFS
jgi:hypothetical protein